MNSDDRRHDQRAFDKPNVRYFPVHELVDKYCDSDIEVATPDGFHYTPDHASGGIGSAAGRADRRVGRHAAAPRSVNGAT